MIYELRDQPAGRAESRLAAVRVGSRSNFVNAVVQADRSNIKVGSAPEGRKAHGWQRSTVSILSDKLQRSASKNADMVSYQSSRSQSLP